MSGLIQDPSFGEYATSDVHGCSGKIDKIHRDELIQDDAEKFPVQVRIDRQINIEYRTRRCADGERAEQNDRPNSRIDGPELTDQTFNLRKGIGLPLFDFAGFPFGCLACATGKVMSHLFEFRSFLLCEPVLGHGFMASASHGASTRARVPTGERDTLGLMENHNSTRGRGMFVMLFVLILFGGVATFFYPLLLVMFPDRMAVVERFRGVYTGPTLAALPEGYEGVDPGSEAVNTTVTENEQRYFFVPAADFTYYLQARTEWFQDVTLDLYDPETDTLVDSNRRYPAYTGRFADMWSDMGEEPELSHAMGMSVSLTGGKLYELRFRVEERDALGDRAVVSVEPDDNPMEVPSIWMLFSVLLVVVVIGGRILLWIFRNRRRS